MAKCKSCGSSTTKKKKLAEFRDDLMGIPVVVFNSVVQETCANCGKILGVLIPNLEGLIAAIAITRVKMKRKFSGSEVRFMRKALGWKAKELADRLAVTPEAVSKWENDKNPMAPQSEQYLRLVVCNLLAAKAPKIECRAEEIVNMRVSPVRAVGPLPLLGFQLSREVVNNDNEQWRYAKAA